MNNFKQDTRVVSEPANIPGILIFLSTEATYIKTGVWLDTCLVGTCGGKHHGIGQRSDKSSSVLKFIGTAIVYSYVSVGVAVIDIL